MNAVIFDMDGVIFNTENLWRDGFIIANKKYNLNLDENYRKTICGKSEQQIRNELKEIYNNLNVDEYRDYIINYVNEHYEHKNILFLAKSYIVKSAMYNKNFRYNRLYNVYSEFSVYGKRYN